MYDGQYAATALYIAQQLRRLGALRQEVDSAKMNGLCNVIYQYRLKHIVDSRYRRQEVLAEIIEYLQNVGAIGNLDEPVAFAVHDAWEFYPQDPRRFGFLVRAGGTYRYGTMASQTSYRSVTDRLEIHFPVQPPTVVDTVSILHSQAGYYSNDKSDGATGNLMARAEWHKPISFRWQLDGTGSAYVDFNTDQIENNVRQRARESYGASAQLAATYLIDARTSAALTSYLGYEHFRQTHHSTATPNSLLLDNTHRGWTVDARGTFVYRISVPTTLKFTVDYRRTDRKDVQLRSRDQRTSSSYVLGISVEHYLF